MTIPAINAQEEFDYLFLRDVPTPTGVKHKFLRFLVANPSDVRNWADRVGVEAFYTPGEADAEFVSAEVTVDGVVVSVFARTGRR